MPLIGMILAFPSIGPSSLFIAVYGSGVYGGFWRLLVGSMVVATGSVAVSAVLVGVPFELSVVRRRALDGTRTMLARCLAYALWGAVGGYFTYLIITNQVLDGPPPDVLPLAIVVSFLLGGVMLGIGYTIYEQYIEHMHTSARMTQELSVARAIQRDLFPQRFPEINGLSFAAHCTPARETGGDFYDLIDLGQGRVGVVVADVAGKSVAAALLMANARSIWRAAAASGASPRIVLEQTNRALCQDIHSFAFVTLFYAIIDVTEPGVRFAGAGHPLPLLCHPRAPVHPNADTTPVALSEMVGPSLRELDANGLPLGLAPDAEYKEIWVSLLPGDRLVLYTDGVVESLNAQREMFGFERLNNVLTQLTADHPQDIVDGIVSAVERFQGPVEQLDDITILSIRIDKSRL
jgi:serine phosphatase RsbU (regulator of sigma subunit)